MHPESEHGLRVQLATTLRERDEAHATTEKWLRVVEQLRENLNAALLERDALRAEVKRLREALGGLNPLPARVLNEACEWRQSVDYARVVKWMQEKARAALASHADGEEDGNADLRDSGEGAPRQVLESEDP